MTHKAPPSGNAVQRTDTPQPTDKKSNPDPSATPEAVFMADIGHDMLSSLNGILAITNLLQKTRLDVEQNDYVRSIRLSIDTLLATINDILDFSKVTAGLLALETTTFDLHDAVESAADLAAIGIQSKDLEIAALIDGNVPRKVAGDPVRLRQVLTSLGSHAVRFTDTGEVVFIVKQATSPPEEPSDEIEIEFEISDTGTGATEENYKTLLSSPGPADVNPTRNRGGLGLAIARHLIELMGGKISVESQKGKGTRFRFTCRFKPAAPAAEARVTTVGELNGMRCLVVGDNPASHKVLDWYIHRWGGVCKHCDNRKDAVQWIETSSHGLPFEVVIVDFRHGNPHKYKTIASAVREDACAATIPLLCLVPREKSGESAFLRDYGYYAYLTKPIGQVHLYNALTLIRQKPASDACAAPDPAAGSFASHRAYVLVVDDNPVNRKVLVAMLGRQNIRCDVAENGEQAVTACARNRYDLIFMDCLMPVMDGYEATRKIREMHADVPIVAITADVLPESRGRCLAAGMNDYITKPFNMQGLLDAANRHLKAKS